jgi:hypothetical protein
MADRGPADAAARLGCACRPPPALVLLSTLSALFLAIIKIEVRVIENSPSITMTVLGVSIKQ